MDALEVEMIGRDVGHDAGVVRLVAHAAEDEAAPGGLEDGDIDVRAFEDLPRAAGAGPVAGFDEPLVNEDAV